jgi:hypothetical protein
MIPVPAGVRVWLAMGHTDMRKGFDGLALSRVRRKSKLNARSSNEPKRGLGCWLHCDPSPRTFRDPPSRSAQARNRKAGAVF